MKPKNSLSWELKTNTSPLPPQQLAALFLTRQIVGNIKESCIPYFLEQLKLAKLSFELFGALTPSDTGRRPLAPDPTFALDDPSEGRKGDLSDLGKGICAQQSAGQKDAQEASLDPVPKLEGKSRLVSQAEVEANMSKVRFECAWFSVFGRIWAL